MQIETMEPMKVTLSEINSNEVGAINPFLQDNYHMGVHVGSNVVIMYEKHDTQRQPYIIVINTFTGERIKINLD